MKKLITKYWGLVLVVVLLSSLFVVGAPVSAGNFSLDNSRTLPTGQAGNTTLAPVAGFGISAMAQSGDTVYVTGVQAPGNYWLYKSTNGGLNWTNLSANLTIGGINWNKIAVAPDDPNFVVVVTGTLAGFNDVVYLSTTGGTVFTALPAGGTGLKVNSIAVSPTNGVTRYIAVGGHIAAVAVGTASAGLKVWTYGAAAPAWTNPGSATLGTVFAPATPIPATATGAVVLDDVEVVAFSSNFLADQTMMIVTETTTVNTVKGECTLHVFSFNTNNWDAAIDVSFPRVLKSAPIGSGLTVASATIAQDANFFLADQAAQIGFVGADITSNGTQNGGVFRIGTYTVTGGLAYLTQIMTGTPIKDVTWDGTNLIASQNAAGGVIWRSSTALAVIPAFMQNTTLKAPCNGGGIVNAIGFTTTLAIASSNGTNASFATSADFGKSWNGISFMSSTSFATVTDFWTSPDATVKYFITDSGAAPFQVWRMDGTVTKRIMLLTAVTGQVWLVRADNENPANVYIGRQTATNMYKSTDSGETIWTARSSSSNIADFAVQDANTIYVGVTGAARVVKSTNGAFTWGLPVAIPSVLNGGGTVYSLNLIADDNMLVGLTAGGLAYTTDGGATYNAVGGVSNMLTGNVVATADSLAAGGHIYGYTSNAGSPIYRWTIGTSIMWDGGVVPGGAAVPVNIGIALSNGVLYVLNDVGGNLTRVINPATNILVAENFVEAIAATQGVNKLQAAKKGTTSTVYALSTTGAIDTLCSFTDYLTSTTTVPTPIYPLTGTKIDVNSISGAVAGFTFQWNSPGIVTIPNPAYRYDLAIYLDEAGTILVINTAVATPAAATVAPTVSIASTAVGAGFAGVPGTTYYWRVRVTANVPGQSNWSSMQSFAVKQLTAVVPVLASPANGAAITAGMSPAFSWSPISAALSYKFEVSVDPGFATTLYSTTTTSAGAAVPSTVTLKAGTNYFWRVKTLTPTEGEWSSVGNFSVAAPVITTTAAPAITPTLTVILPSATTTVITVPPATTVTTEVNPSYIWAIIIIGAVLVIAVIVLIVRTRRSV